MPDNEQLARRLADVLRQRESPGIPTSPSYHGAEKSLRERKYKAAPPVATTGKVLVLLSKGSEATGKTKYYLCGDRKPQLIYESNADEYINFKLEIEGVGRDSWVVSGVRYVPTTQPNPISQVRELEVITIKPSGIVRSPKVSSWSSTSPHNDFNQAFFLGNASWNITLVPFFYEIASSFATPNFPGYALGAELDTLTSTGSLYTGQITPTQDPFSRIVHKRALGVYFYFANGSLILSFTFDQIRSRAGLNLGDKNDSVSVTDDSMVITPSPAPSGPFSSADCGSEVGIALSSKTGKIKSLSYFVQGNTISLSEGLIDAKENYSFKAHQLNCASNTRGISDIAFSESIGGLFTSGTQVIEKNELSREEAIAVSFKFSAYYPAINISGARKVRYNTGVNERTYNGVHIGNVFAQGQGYFYQDEAASHTETASFPEFMSVPPLSGARTPLKVVLSPGSAPITPNFLTDGQDNFGIANNSTGTLGDSDSIRRYKRWRVKEGQLFMDKTTNSVGLPGELGDLGGIDRFARGQQISVQILSYKMSASGQFSKIKTQISKLVPISGTEALNGNVIEALYYGV